MEFHIFFKALRKAFLYSYSWIYTPLAKTVLFLNGARFGKNLKARGFLKVLVTRRGSVLVGNNLVVNSGHHFNVIGRQQNTIFWVEGKLIIGNNVGMSSTAIICNHEIEIGDFVTIGGNTVIYDTDFHSLDPVLRNSKYLDKKNAKSGKVKICNNVFIGAHTTILKCVTIGENSIVGACSLVTKDIPANEIWGGNPATFRKTL